MEAVDGLDEVALGAAVGPDDLGEEVAGRVHLDVLELVLDVAGHLGELRVEGFGDAVGPVADALVRVHPSPAGARLEAVEVVVEGLIGDVLVEVADRMDARVHCLVQDAAVDEGGEDDDRVLRELRISREDRLVDRGVVLLWGRHAVEVRAAVAHVVANHREEGEDRLVGVAVTREEVDPLDELADARAVDAQVLVVAVVAAVERLHLAVDGGHGASDGRGVLGAVAVASRP